MRPWSEQQEGEANVRKVKDARHDLSQRQQGGRRNNHPQEGAKSQVGSEPSALN